MSVENASSNSPIGSSAHMPELGTRGDLDGILGFVGEISKSNNTLQQRAVKRTLPILLQLLSLLSFGFWGRRAFLSRVSQITTLATLPGAKHMQALVTNLHASTHLSN